MNICRFTAMLFLAQLACVITSRAQINADRDYVKQHKIRSATLQYPNQYEGVVFYYDREGRLQKMVSYSWWPGPEGVGNSSVENYDTLGRNVSVLYYTFKDSLNLKSPRDSDTPASAEHFEYIGDSIEIVTDTTWDEFHRLTEIRRRETTTIWADMPPAPELRSAFYPDQYISSQLDFRTTTIYAYLSDTARTPFYETQNRGFSILTGKLEHDRIVTHYIGDGYAGDSASHCMTEYYYTLHGDRDTLYSEYRLTKTRIDEPSNIEKTKPYVSSQVVHSKKRFGTYHVRYHYSWTKEPKWSKFKSKTPWTSYQVLHTGRSFAEPDEYYTFYNFSEAFNVKPVFTYWP